MKGSSSHEVHHSVMHDLVTTLFSFQTSAYSKNRYSKFCHLSCIYTDFDSTSYKYMLMLQKTREMYCRIMGNVGQSVAAELLKMEKEIEQKTRTDGDISVNIVVDSKKSQSKFGNNNSGSPVHVEVYGLQGSHGDEIGKAKADNNPEAQESHSSTVEVVKVYQCEGGTMFPTHALRGGCLWDGLKG